MRYISLGAHLLAGTEPARLAKDQDSDIGYVQGAFSGEEEEQLSRASDSERGGAGADTRIHDHT